MVVQKHNCQVELMTLLSQGMTPLRWAKFTEERSNTNTQLAMISLKTLKIFTIWPKEAFKRSKNLDLVKILLCLSPLVMARNRSLEMRRSASHAENTITWSRQLAIVIRSKFTLKWINLKQNWIN